MCSSPTSATSRRSTRSWRPTARSLSLHVRRSAWRSFRGVRESRSSAYCTLAEGVATRVVSTPREQRPITALRGVGEALAEKLQRLGVTQIQDLLFLLPL